MRIAVIGTGRVGTALGTAFADEGHEVMLGSRTPQQPRLAEWTAHDPEHRRLGDPRAATEFGDVVVMAVPGRVLPETLDAIGRDAFAAKVVLDATNPFAYDEHGDLYDAYGDDDSGSEYLQRELPSASVVKAFDQISWRHVASPADSPIEVLRIAGDDEAAKARVAQLGAELGWPVRDLGALKKARALERGVLGLRR